jgi:hypothetical protein
MPMQATLANILEREMNSTIAAWLFRVDAEHDILSVPLSDKERSAYLPAIFSDLLTRLRDPLPLGTRALLSDGACEHGRLRRQQGYTAAMVVEESRLLQVSIFETLKRNVGDMYSPDLMKAVMAIADEIDSQLAQAMASFAPEAIMEMRAHTSDPIPFELGERKRSPN